MSNAVFENVPIGKQAQGLEVSPRIDAYSGVEIIIDDETSVFAGNRSGRVLTIENEWGTQEQAQNILNSLRSTGFQYQPYTASGAIVNPAAEVGDGVIVNGVHSGIYKVTKTYGPLMLADIEAPMDEEVDHEFPFEPKQDRVYKREIADTKAQIKITSDAIESEVIRATNAEGTLSSRITQTASEINATVSGKLSATGGSSSSFGWTLTSSGWELKSNNTTVFKVTSAGAEVRGKITATSGYIGNGTSGFTITSSAIYNGMTSLGDTTHNGIYVGADGIALGKGNFKVTSGGNVSANNMKLTGTLTIGSSTITADQLRQGAYSAYSNGGSWSSGASWVANNGSYVYGGAGYGFSFANAIDSGSGSYPGYFRATVLSCSTLAASNITSLSKMVFQGYNCYVVTINGRKVMGLGG